ncbi:MAG TPA: hypothetical protein VLC48_08115 [Gemmatimonadota bacterium]|nr:hypothetical protein [Gemmatimonadota bacterium]
MRKLGIPLAVLLLLSGRALVGVPAQQQEDPKTKAEGWIAQADSVKALVETVLAGAVEAGAAEHAVAKDQVNDARRWTAEGEKALLAAKEAYEAADYTGAGNKGNLAWQYYVKAGTAAVLAGKLVSGGS